MSYTPASHPPPPPPPNYYASTPPAPPPKPSNTSSPAQGPPLPPPPPGGFQNEPSELDGGQGYHYQQQERQQYPGQAHPHGYRPVQAAQQINIPPIEADWLPQSLRDKNTTDLHNLLHDASLQSAFLSDPNTTHPAIPAAQAHLTPLLESNIALAGSLTNLETRLSQKRTQTQSRLLALRALEQQHRAKIAETEKALEQFSPMALYQRLSASVQEQEQLVRGVEESWLEMESDVATPAEVEAFVKRVREARKVAFLRRERKERWDEARVGGWR